LRIAGVGYGLGLSYLVLSGFPADWTRMLKVDILQCIGVSMALLAPCVPTRRGARWPALAAAIALVLLAQLTWRLPLYDWMPDAVAGYLTREAPGSRFPLLPYGGWLALGLFVGPLWSAARGNPRAERRFWGGLLVSTLACLVLWQIGGWLHVRSGLQQIGSAGRSPATTVHFFLFKAGLLFLLLFAARVSAPLLDRFRRGPLVLLGRTSLFAYCAHLIAAYYLFGPFWLGRLAPLEQAAGSLLLGALTLCLCWLWRRRGRLVAWWSR
jgi:hypothetical protein